MADFIEHSIKQSNDLIYEMHVMAKRVPFLKDIPAFTSMPKGIEKANLRFYKLSNLVLTLG